ncbi:hypothetical protein [Polyangium mundeleinium]|uniref:Uncharacterized protein n=1 Tax=Polyangium mundeleinium TaxID=2995306 RepID=A0ABT5EE92_9BACT|nr:hypothetical protein [Polyangium mundeleinium]MDC0740131.1 hypothetical protein [Polyangium mundeleinium]
MKTFKALRRYLHALADQAVAETRLINAEASRQYLAAADEVVNFVTQLLNRPAPTQAAGASTSSSSAGAASSGASTAAGAASDIAPPPSPSPLADEEPGADELDQALELLGETRFPGMVALARRYKAVEALKDRLNGRGLANDDPEQLLEAVVRMVESEPAGVPTGA